ncbi:hypothetical protein D3C86_2029660 [compost metagenome]
MCFEVEIGGDWPEHESAGADTAQQEFWVGIFVVSQNGVDGFLRATTRNVYVDICIQKPFISGLLRIYLEGEEQRRCPYDNPPCHITMNFLV